MALTEGQQQRINNIQMIAGSVALVGSIVGVIYSHRTGGGFWRGVGYWILGGLVFGIPAHLVTTPFVNKIIKDSEQNPKPPEVTTPIGNTGIGGGLKNK